VRRKSTGIDIAPGRQQPVAPRSVPMRRDLEQGRFGNRGPELRVTLLET
jgi:hypothetical protein